MKILSIETSCDDTCISILEVHPARNGRGKGDATNASFKVLANNSNSQINVHIPYGGVYPVLAKREHAKNLPIVLEASLKQAHLTPAPLLGKERGSKKSIDAIAVTYGPGLEMCLWEGIIFAKELAKKWKAPLIPVNHMEGHVVSVFGKEKGNFKIPKIKTPALSLLVSGGHTQLVLMKKWMDYEIIGRTLDDAVGEAFDKVARMLDLPYPGGPQISKLAETLRALEKQFLRGNVKSEKEIPLEGTPQGDGLRTEQIFQQKNCDPERGDFLVALPRPMLHSKNFDFSFAGLKTAVLYLIRDLKKKDSNILQNDKIKSAIALEFENAAIECLVHKTKKAMEKYGAKTLIVAGGVACNTHLQREIKKNVASQTKLFLPPKGLAGDNSLMIGIAGYLNYIKDKKKVPKPEDIKATGNLKL